MRTIADEAGIELETGGCRAGDHGGGLPGLELKVRRQYQAVVLNRRGVGKGLHRSSEQRDREVDRVHRMSQEEALQRVEAPARAARRACEVGSVERDDMAELGDRAQVEAELPSVRVAKIVSDDGEASAFFGKRCQLEDGGGVGGRRLLDEDVNALVERL